MEIKVVFNSLEYFLKDRRMARDYPSRFDKNGQIKSPDILKQDQLTEENINRDRDYLRTEERRLFSLCEKLRINKNLYKHPKSGKYVITEEVAILFRFILNHFGEDQQIYVKKGQFESVPQDSLIALRAQILDALTSLDVDSSTIKQQLQDYEKATGCPPKNTYISHSSLTDDAVQYLKDDVKLSDQEWDLFMDQLEYGYRYEWRPLFITNSQNLLKKYLKEIGKEDLYPDDEMTATFGKR